MNTKFVHVCQSKLLNVFALCSLCHCVIFHGCRACTPMDVCCDAQLHTRTYCTCNALSMATNGQYPYKNPLQFYCTKYYSFCYSKVL